MANTVWSAVSNISLSNGGLTATVTAAPGVAQSQDFKTTGKLAVEFTINTAASSFMGVGLATALIDGSGLPTFNSSAQSTWPVFVARSGIVYLGGITVGSVTTLAGTDVISIEVDVAAQTASVRKNGGTAVTGSFQSHYDTFIAPAFQSNAAGDAVTLNTGDTAFVYPPSSGYTAGWPTGAPPTTLLASQIGVGVFAKSPPSDLYVSQIGMEVWRKSADAFDSALMVSQIALEVWRSVSGSDPSTGVTLSPTDRDDNLLLSNGNLTATMPASGLAQDINATESKSSGKWVFGVTVDAFVNGAAGLWAGVRKTSASEQWTGIAQTSNSWVSRFIAGTETSLGNVGGTGWNAVGRKLMVAVDLDAKMFWLKVEGEAWNNNASADPSTGAGGYDFSGCGAGSYFPFVVIGNTSQRITANFGASDFSLSVPSGYLAWDGSGAAPVFAPFRLSRPIVVESCSPDGNGTAPAITVPAVVTQPENSTYTVTLIADRTVAWSLSGPDAGKFTLTDASLTLGPHDYENADDANADHHYSVTVTATGGNGLTTSATIDWAITNVSPEPVVAVWNPNDKGTGVLLTNGNLTATGTGSNNTSIVRATGYRTGKVYFEVVINSANTDVGIGFANKTLPINGTQYLGGDSNSIAYWANDAMVYAGPNTYTAGNPAAQGEVIRIAADLDKKFFWWARGTGSWNAIPVGNPTGPSGAFYMAALSGNLYAAVHVANGQVTARFDAASFTYPIPTGYTAYGVGTLGDDATAGPAPTVLTYTTQQQRSTADGQVFENLDVDYSGSGPAVLILHKNCIVRNTRIKHRNAQGLYVNTSGQTSGFVGDNLEVIWATAPTGVTMANGEQYKNVEFEEAPGSILKNSSLYYGTANIMIKTQSPNCQIINVEGYDVHGAASGPRGQFAQIINGSHNCLIDTYYAKNGLTTSYTEDIINVADSNGVIIKNGLMDGCNGPSGWHILFEGTTTGSVSDVWLIRSGSGGMHVADSASGTATRVTITDGITTGPRGDFMSGGGCLFDGGGGGIGISDCHYARPPSGGGALEQGNLSGTVNAGGLRTILDVTLTNTPAKPTTVSHNWA